MIRSAIRYAAAGWRVLPLLAREKAPDGALVRHGVQQATTDPDVIRYWWGKSPNANVGLAAGFNFIVVDVDPRNGGDCTLADLEQKHGELPETATALTGSEGLHILLRRPEFPTVGKLPGGIDILNRGKYIVAAPSVHPNGNKYRWLTTPRVPISTAPAWLLEMIRRRELRAPNVPPADPETRVDVNERVRRARAYARALPPAISGQGGHTQTFLAAQKIARGFDLDAVAAYAVMAEHFNPRCEPPWSKAELVRKVHEAISRGTFPIGSLLKAERSAA